jgi:UDP-N-acetyl-D-mannosaminuronate dehydrogenase
VKSLIIGAGQVGSSLLKIISPHHESYIRDVDSISVEGVEVLHICYPDSASFVDTTKSYIEEYKPKLTVINSSVAVGKTAQCGPHVVNSPVRGRHPNLETEMLHYPKFIGTDNRDDADLAAKYFQECGWETVVCDSNTTEFLKLISNVHMGLEIAWRQEVGRMMRAFGVSVAAYEEWERSYNEGYRKSGHDNLIRPLMRPGPIGGHCILPCTEILLSQFYSPVLQFILDSNEKAKAG